MSREFTPDYPAFGELQPMSTDRIGRITALSDGAGLYGLLDGADRDRGFFSHSDRQLLVHANWDDQLAKPTERNARMRIRNRVLSAFFDARYLRLIADQDRELIFEKAKEAGSELHFREAFKEFIRFTYRGLLEADADVDITDIVETAVQEAKREHAVAAGTPTEYEVELQVTQTTDSDPRDLERRYHQRDTLSRHELAALVNCDHTSTNQIGADAADISLVDALYYDARQSNTEIRERTQGDTDRDDADELVEWLRSAFDTYDITTYDELETGLQRLRLVDPQFHKKLVHKLIRLVRTAPAFESQRRSQGALADSDMQLVHAILFDAGHRGVEAALESNARPPTAGSEWDPSTDDFLQQFIARVEASNMPISPEGQTRWNTVLQLAEFDPEHDHTTVEYRSHESQATKPS
mgnify:CR=1 FL=1